MTSRGNRARPETGMTRVMVTLICLLGVTLVMLGVGYWQTSHAGTQRSTCRSLLGRYSEAILEWREQHLRGDCPPGLEAVAPAVAGDQDHRDPWGERIVYQCPGRRSNVGFDLWSKGPDRIAGTVDDIKEWE